MTIPTPFKVRRPAGGRNFPLVDFFYYTGEKWNPWRCGRCATKKQKDQAVEVTEEEAIRFNDGIPGCCRKCSTDYYR